MSFVLTESLAIKRVAALDVLKEQADAGRAGDDERFDADFVLMTGELGKLIAGLAGALGGGDITEPLAPAPYVEQKRGPQGQLSRSHRLGLQP